MPEGGKLVYRGLSDLPRDSFVSKIKELTHITTMIL
jgi:hypothetical protein